MKTLVAALQLVFKSMSFIGSTTFLKSENSFFVFNEEVVQIYNGALSIAGIAQLGVKAITSMNCSDSCIYIIGNDVYSNSVLLQIIPSVLF